MNSKTEQEFLCGSGSNWLPVAVLALWFVALGWLLWPACNSSQPPVWDAVSYAQKAKNVWSSIAQGKITSLLEAYPSFRPPGTVLMSYPFGYSENTQGFNFRSVFIPACLFGIATYIAATAAGVASRMTKWFAALVAAAASTLPLFYQFHFSPDVFSSAPSGMFVAHWGLVDGFIGSVSAFAVALLIYANASRNHRLLKFVALCLSALCFYIKHVGLLAFGVCAGMFLVLQWVWIRREGKFADKNLMLDFGLVMLAGCLLIPAFRSSYLGPKNMAHGSVAMGLLKSEMSGEITAPWALSVIFHLLGYIPACLLLLGVVAGLVALFRSKGSDRLELVTLLVFATIWFACGLFLVVQTSVGHVRYAFPFWLPAIICIVAVAFRGKGFWRYKSLAVALAVALVVQLSSLLDQLINYQDPERPSKLAGWNMRPADVPELAPFYSWFSAQSQKHREKTVLYDAAVGIAPSVIGSAIYYDSAVTRHYQKGGFTLEYRAPLNWRRPSGVYRNELEDVDFVMANTTPMPLWSADISQQLANFQSAIAKTPPEESGLSPTSLGPNAVIYEVSDRGKFLKWLVATVPNESHSP